MAAAILLCCGLQAAEAATWHVKADTGRPGNGSSNRPFTSLAEVEARSQPGDTIVVLPSKDALDGGIQLKEGQRLIGQGAPVTRVNMHAAHAILTNTSRDRLDGDIVRLAAGNVVENIHFDFATRSSIFGVNAAGARIRGNLFTNDMSAHDIFAIEGPAPGTCRAIANQPVCGGEWPNGYIVFAPQTNHFGAITLVTCGPHPRVLTPRPDVLLQPVSYCQFLVPGSGSVASPVELTISGNVIRDSNSDGIMLINDTGVVANVRATGNVVKDLSQPLPDPFDPAVGLTDHVVRSRGITLITIDQSVSTLVLSDFTASNLSPRGQFAADGVVLLTAGTSANPQLGPVTNAALSDLWISNPFLTGDTSNGDSIEIQHRGSTNGVLNVDIRRATLSDPASTNIKLIESTNPDNGIYNVSVSDSVLTNINTAGNEDAQIRYNGTERSATMAVWLALKNVRISGLGRGIGLTVPAPPARTVNTNNIRSFRVFVESSSLSDLTGEAFYWSQGATALLGTSSDRAIVDLGGGPLGSSGGNRFVNNGVPGHVPPGADPAGVDPADFDGDVSVSNANLTIPAIAVYGSNNYWGGGPPVVSTVPSVSTDVFIPAASNVTFTSSGFRTRDPRR